MATNVTWSVDMDNETQHTGRRYPLTGPGSIMKPEIKREICAAQATTH